MNFILAIVWLVPFAVASSSFFSLFKAHGIVILFFCTSFVPRAHYWFEFHLECNDFSDLMWFNDSYQCLNAYVSNCALYELVSFPYRSLVNSKFLFAFHIFFALVCTYFALTQLLRYGERLIVSTGDRDTFAFAIHNLSVFGLALAFFL